MRTLPHAGDRFQTATPNLNLNPVLLGLAYRELDDLTMRGAITVVQHMGGDPWRILESGYGMSNPAFGRAVRAMIKRSSIILPCRDERGQIVALHDHRRQWLTLPAVHIANPARARFAEIKILETVSVADSVALNENICAIARNGCDDQMVHTAIQAAERMRCVA